MPATTAPHPSAPHPSAALRRLRHALLHWRTGRHPAPARPSRQDQLQALLQVLDEAVAAQPLADQVVAACGEPGPVPGSVAQDGRRQLATFNRLAARLHGLVVDNDLLELHDRASRLLAYHLWMINESLKFAFTCQRDNARIEAARLRINGIGAPGNALRRVRDEVRQLALGHRTAEQARW